MALPILSFVAPSGTGKTTLIEQLVSVLTGQGYRVGVVKHGHHRPTFDQPGKDTFRFRQAGATAVAYVMDDEWFFYRAGHAEEAWSRMAELASDHDLVLVEGYKSLALPKMVLYRSGIPLDPSRYDLGQVVAMVTDTPEFLPELVCPRFGFAELDSMADFIVTWMRGQKSESIGRS